MAVSKTRIFARPVAEGRQVLVYSMSFQADSELAMILPLPVPAGSPEDALRFVSLEGYDEFFDDMKKAFPIPLPQAAFAVDAFPASAPIRKMLVVQDVGDFEASFVPTLADFDRLDPRFKLSGDVWAQLPQYADWGFAVFKLKGESGKKKDVHPMAFEFPRRDPSTLFFPTVHVHDGEVHDEAVFDHVLYCQPDPVTAATFAWQCSGGHIRHYMNVDECHGLIDPDAYCYRKEIKFSRPNRDQVLTPPACSDPSRLVSRGACFELKLTAAAAYWDDTVKAKYPARRTHAREHLDQLADALPKQIVEHLESRRDAFGLIDYDEKLMHYREEHDRLHSRIYQGADGTWAKPIAGEPLRADFEISDERVEPQTVTLAFAAPPDAELIARVKQALGRALAAVELG